MEPIDVLRHDGYDFARPLERHDSVVDRVWLRVPIDLPALELEVPVLDSRRFRREKLVVVHRAPPRPHAARAAEIGNPAGGRYTRPREDEDAMRPSQLFDQAPVGHGPLYHPRLSDTDSCTGMVIGSSRPCGRATCGGRRTKQDV